MVASSDENGPTRPSALYKAPVGWSANAGREAQEQSAMDHVRANYKALQAKRLPGPQGGEDEAAEDAPEAGKADKAGDPPEAKLGWATDYIQNERQSEGEPARGPTTNPPIDRAPGSYEKLTAAGPTMEQHAIPESSTVSAEHGAVSYSEGEASAEQLRVRQAEETKEREGLHPNQTSETAPPTKEAREMTAREEALAAYARVRGSGPAAATKEDSPERQASRSTDRGGSRGR